jgi:arsenate reductase-like glutaredoxin family protein
MLFCDDCMHPMKGKWKTHTTATVAEYHASGDAIITTPDTTITALESGLPQDERPTMLGEFAVLCWQHMNQTIKVYCETCNKAVCMICASNDHIQHDMRELEPSRKEQLALLATMVKSVEEILPNACEVVADLRAAKDQLTINTDIARKTTRAAFQRHIQTLVDREKQMEAAIELADLKKRDELNCRIKEIEVMMATARDGASLASCVLKHGSAAEMLLLRPSMVGGLGALTERRDRLLSPQHVGIRVEFSDQNPELITTLQNFGTVLSAEIDLSDGLVFVAGDGAEKLPSYLPTCDLFGSGLLNTSTSI